jgi:hypothetical protein
VTEVDAKESARVTVQQALGNEIPVDGEALVPAKVGWGARRAMPKRLAAIALVRPVLNRALLAGERVRFVSYGVRVSGIEQYLQGAFAVLNNTYAVVLTDQRLLMLQVHGRGITAWYRKSGRLGDLKNAIPLSSIRSAKGLLQLVLTLRDRSKISLSYMPGVDRKHLKSLVAEATAATAPEREPRSLQHLCPGCLHPIPGAACEALRCPNDACRIPLRSGRRAAWFSALLPGVGDLYLRHFTTGAQEFLGSMAGLAATALAWMFAFYVGNAESMITASIVTAVCFVLPRIIDYPLTRYMARKGNVPLSYESPAAGPGVMLPPGMEPVLPAFPRWVIAMFALSGAALVAVLVAAQPLVLSTARVERAIDAAEAHHWEAANAEWQQAVELGFITHEERGRMARAYLEGGQREAGHALLDEIGDHPIDAEVADALNRLLAAEQASEPGASEPAENEAEAPDAVAFDPEATEDESEPAARDPEED